MDLIGFALAVLLIELTPGPNMAWLAGLSATEGRRTGFAAVAGVALGLLLNGALAAAGLTVLLASAPAVWTGLRLAGAGLLAAIAVQTWIGGRAGSGTEADTDTRSRRRAFLTGLLVNLLNPKAYMFFVVIVPQFMNGRTLRLREAMILSMISASIATAIHIGLVLAGSQAQAWLSDPARTKRARQVFAVLLMAMALSSLLL